jgi:hypothetical protein
LNDPRDHHTTQRSRTLRAGRTGGGGASLVVIHGDRLGQRVDIGDKPAVIGRASDCALQFDHRSVSRHHCRIWREEGSYHVRDLGSTNHTYVNDRAVAQSELRDGEHIAVGETVLKFVRRDEVLRAFGAALRTGMRAQDTGGRLGGEEFAVILPQTALVGAVALAERLRVAIESTPVAIAGTVQSVAASLGVAMFDPGMSSASDLMRAADDQLLRARQSGRNRVCVAGR